PGLHTIIEAHRSLERYVSTKILNEVKETMDTRWGYLCYSAYWLDPVMDAINAFNDSVNEKAEGDVTVRLFKGNTTVVALKSPNALAFASFNNAEGYKFNVNASAGFIELYTLQMKIANEIKRKKKK
ncbi:MAG: argininosuccinate synthase, partial [Patescibacteria group bacterium]